MPRRRPGAFSAADLRGDRRRAHRGDRSRRRRARRLDAAAGRGRRRGRRDGEGDVRKPDDARSRRAPASAPSCDTTYTGPPFYTSPPTVGGDGSNGKLPPSALTAVSWATDSHGTPYYLRTDAAAALERLDQAFRAAFGHHLDLDLTYRDYDTQVAMRAALGTRRGACPAPRRTAPASRSTCPSCRASTAGTPRSATWLVSNGPVVRLDLAVAGRSQNGSNPEYWHFDYVG